MSRAHNALLAALLLGQAMAIAHTSIVNVAAPSIRQTFDATGPQLELVVSGYILALAILMFTCVRPGHLRGSRTIFLSGLVMFTAASTACGLATSITVLIALARSRALAPRAWCRRF